MEAHIIRERRNGSQPHAPGVADVLYDPIMNLAVLAESDLCLVPYVPPQSAPVSAPAAHTLPTAGSSSATTETITRLSSDSVVVDDEDEGLQESGTADSTSSMPTTPDDFNSALLNRSTLVDILERATTIGRYYLYRIDELGSEHGVRHILSTDGLVFDERLRDIASRFLRGALESFDTAAAGVKDCDLEVNQLRKYAQQTYEQMGIISDALTWYSNTYSIGAATTEDDKIRLAIMQRCLLSSFKLKKVSVNLDEMEETENNE